MSLGVAAGVLATVDSPLGVVAGGVAVVALVLLLPVVAVLLTVLALRCLADLVSLVDLLGVERLDLNRIVAGLVLVTCVARLASFPRRVPWWPLIVATAMLAAGYWWGRSQLGPHPSLSREALREASLLAVFLLPMTMARETVVRLLRGLPYVGAVPACVALFQVASTGARATATFPHPNAAAVAFGALCLVATAQARTGSSRMRRLAALLALGLFATGSLAGVAAFLVALWVLLSLPDRGTERDGFAGGSRPSARRRVLVPLLGVALVGVMFVMSPVGGERIAELSSTRSLEAVRGGVTTNSLDWRFFNWSQLAEEWQRSPLLGHGLGATIELVQPGGNLPHNEYLRYLVELGVLGLIVILLAATRLWIVLARRERESGLPTNAASLARALIALLLINGLAANTLLYTSAAYVALAALSASVVLSSSYRPATASNALVPAGDPPRVGR